MRVALVTTSFPLHRGSVSGVFIERLARWLSREASVSVVAPCGSTVDERANEQHPYEVCCFRYAPRRWSVLAHQPGGIPVALQRRRWLFLLLPFFLGMMFVACVRISRKVDVIHANWSVPGFIAGFAGRLMRTPVITTLRGEDIRRAAQSGVYRRLLQGCLRLNQRVVAVSHAIQEEVVDRFPAYAQKVVFVPNGVEPELVQRQLGSSKPDRNRAMRLITIGNLIPLKGVDTIIEAMGSLSSQESVELTVVGQGAERPSLEALAAKLGVEQRVRFVGSVTPREVPDYLGNADALVLASHGEGRPNVVLEAMGFGIPVIATAIPGITELVQGPGKALLFEPGNSAQLAERIRELWTDPELYQQMAREGRDFILNNELLWPNTIERYLEVYRQVREELRVRPDFSTR